MELVLFSFLFDPFGASYLFAKHLFLFSFLFVESSLRIFNSYKKEIFKRYL